MIRPNLGSKGVFKRIGIIENAENNMIPTEKADVISLPETGTVIAAIITVNAYKSATKKKVRKTSYLISIHKLPWQTGNQLI